MCMYVYIYIYIYTHVYVHAYICFMARVEVSAFSWFSPHAVNANMVVLFLARFASESSLWQGRLRKHVKGCEANAQTNETS